MLCSETYCRGQSAARRIRCRMQLSESCTRPLSSAPANQRREPYVEQSREWMGWRW